MRRVTAGELRINFRFNRIYRRPVFLETGVFATSLIPSFFVNRSVFFIGPASSSVDEVLFKKFLYLKSSYILYFIDSHLQIANDTE